MLPVSANGLKAVLLGVALLVLSCQGREKERHREAYLEYLGRLEFAFKNARGEEESRKAVLPTTPYEAQQATAAIDKSNLDSKKLLTDLKMLENMEPIDETEREIVSQIVEASVLFNYYLSYRIMGPIVLLRMTPANRSRFKLDSIREPRDFVVRIERAIEENRTLLKNW